MNQARPAHTGQKGRTAMKRMVLAVATGAMLVCGVVPVIPALAEVEYFDTTGKLGNSTEVFTFGGTESEKTELSESEKATASEPEYFDSTSKLGSSDEYFTFGGAEEPEKSTPSEPEIFNPSDKLGSSDEVFEFGGTEEPVSTPSEATPSEPEKPEPSEATPSEPEEVTPAESTPATPSNASGGNGGSGNRSSGGSGGHSSRSSSSDSSDTNVVKQENSTDDHVRVVHTIEHDDDQTLPVTGDNNNKIWGIMSLMSGLGVLFLGCKKKGKKPYPQNA